MTLSLSQSVQILGIKNDSNLIELIHSYRQKAKLYHPDTQQDLADLKKAHENMIILNNAKNILESHWKDKGSFKGLFNKKLKTIRAKHNSDARPIITDELDLVVEKLKERYLFYRERAKKGIYVYYRFGLQKIALRSSGSGFRWYLEYKRYLEKALVYLSTLLQDSRNLVNFDDSGTIREHYDIFMAGFIFFEAFYRAAECSNIMDINEPVWEKQIFQLYRRGCTATDDALSELFIRKAEGERIRFEIVKPNLLEASSIFSNILRKHRLSSWSRETNIKGQLVLAALSYINEFY